MFGNPLLLADEGYQISRSVRLRSSASGYFSRTFSGAPSNNKICTISAWVKRGYLGSNVNHLIAGWDGSASLAAGVWFQNDVLYCDFGGAAGSGRLITTQVFRDPSAWYHLVVQIDTTQATSSNRARIYVNGSQITAFSTATYPALNAATLFAYQNANNRIGANWDNTSPLDGYLTEINFIDGQALTPSSFGETDAITGVWKPKKYIGTYGTNGFYLNFSDNSAATAAAIGKDYSGNGNNWTPNNISVTAGSTYDSMLDVPTLWADGGNGRGNYCVLNALSKMGTPTTSAANLQVNLAASSLINGSVTVSSGKWYYEAQFTSGSDAFIGWNRVDLQTGTGNSFQQAGSLLYFSTNGNRYKDGDGGAAYGASYTTSDAIGCAIDFDNNQVTWYKNNVSQGTISINAGNYAPCLVTGGTICNFLSNFGQRPFTYTPPSGFKALNTQNLPTPTILKGNQYFNAVLYTGNGTGQTVSGVGFQPDFVWGKSRTQIRNHNLYDAVRGAGNMLLTNGTNAELTGGELSAFTSDGFTLGSNVYQMNPSGDSMVAWNWKEGATQGFDIVTWAGNSTSGRTIAHSLGVAPNMIITKSRTNASSWVVGIGGMSGFGVNDYLTMNTTNAKGSSSTFYQAYGSSTFTVGVSVADEMNKTGNNYVSYLFSEVAGFSKFGSYTGNGSADGPFVYTGFRPRFIMLKNVTTAGNGAWVMFDTTRSPSNVQGLQWLFADSSGAESTANSFGYFDILSNGFKCRGSGGNINVNGENYIFAAFAENTFKYSLAR